MKKWMILVLLGLWASLTFAQEQPTEAMPQWQPPLDGIVEKKLNTQRRVLPYQPIREADVFWEKRLSRVIDTREKMNLVFRNPKRPLIDIIKDGLMNKELKAYHINDEEDFSQPATEKEMHGFFYSVDTFERFDPITGKSELVEVHNEINADHIKRFRLKEIWYFDEQTSTMKVRIIGIAPLRDIYDDAGNFLYELPLFWVYYPHARELLAREQVFNPHNDAAPMNWMDVFEMRQFSSYVYKESNVYDRRLEDYLSSVDLLLESRRIQDKVFNFEHDLWAQ